MERLRGKWVVIIGSEAPVLDTEVPWVEQQVAALLAASPVGIVLPITKNPPHMTLAVVGGLRGATQRPPVIGVRFTGTTLPPRISRAVVEWVEYGPAPTARPGGQHDWTALDGHGIAVARMRGQPGILALTRGDDTRERLCRPAALDWRIPVVVRRDPTGALEMPF